MKNLYLLPMLFLLLLAGCQKPDEEVPLPDPEKPISELLIGDWRNYERITIDADNKETTHPITYTVYHIKPEILSIYYNVEGHDQGGGRYTITKSGNRNYIEWIDNINGYAKYEITAITDSSMTWEMTDSLAALSDLNQDEHFRLSFRKMIKHPLESKITGFWDTDTTTRVTYDAAGNILKTEGVTNQISSYEIEPEYLVIYWATENPENSMTEYTFRDEAEKTYLEYTLYREGTTTAYSYEIVSVTDDTMVWKQQVSPTVSYLTTFTRE